MPLQSKLEKLPSIEDRGQTDRVDLYLWPWPSVPGYWWSWNTHTHKLKFKGQSVQNIEWKQTDGLTDGRAVPIALPSRLTLSVNTIDSCLMKFEIC